MHGRTARVSLPRSVETKEIFINFMTNYGSNASRTAVIILRIPKWNTEGNYERASSLISTGQEHFQPYKFLSECLTNARKTSGEGF